MAVMNVNPTRMELTNLKKKLMTARKGHKLLKDKRDELMRRFLILVRENKELRERVEAGIKVANSHMSVARSVMTDEEIEVALMMPSQKMEAEVEEQNIMSVDVPVFKPRLKSANEGEIYSYGYAFTGGDLDDAVEALAGIMPDMLRLAQTENTCRLLASEIEKTRRRVNALEHVLIPRYEETIRYITMKLDENERAATTRLMKVKDMMLESAHHYQQQQ